MVKKQNTASQKYKFLTKNESDKLKKIMSGAGGYLAFVEKWSDLEKSLPIPTANTYYNTLNGRSLKREVLEVIKLIVKQSIEELNELKTDIKNENNS